MLIRTGLTGTYDKLVTQSCNSKGVGNQALLLNLGQLLLIRMTSPNYAGNNSAENMAQIKISNMISRLKMGFTVDNDI